MGGLLHLFDFNQSSMARKVLMHKRHVGGLEAPRNSLELQVETSQNYCDVEDLPCSYQVEENWFERNSNPVEASMKKLINEEISKRPNTRQHGPSIVARLMGMDMLPSDTKSSVQLTERKNESKGIKFARKEEIERVSVGHVPFNSKSSRQIESNSFHHNKDRGDDRWSSSQKPGKPRPREHPQEEELQKFKREFEAWQAARFMECSRVAELDSVPIQLLAQRNLNKEKMAVYANYGRTASERPVELKVPTVKVKSNGKGSLLHHGDRTELFSAKQKESFPLRGRTISRDLEQSCLVNSDQKLDKSHAPTRIVILKPGPDRIYNEESWASSSGTSEERGSIENFLEEVKEQLKCELQGKTLKRGMVVRGSGIETPFSEKPSDPKQLARNIAKQVRESVTRDVGMNLPRSESTRSYRSEIQFNGPGSPEFINQDTRRFLSERLRNVLKRESDLDIPIVVNGNSRSSVLDHKRERLKHMGDTLNSRNDLSYWEIVKDEQDMQNRSFRHGQVDNGVHHRELSPRNLIRSLSAPVSGTSFRKLLLEDRHILTGAQIRRKHEALENVAVDAKKRKKERFNLKEKVSHFRYSFTLRGRLFSRKIQSAMESARAEHDRMKDIMSGPTVIMNFSERHENSTEVPPSPASVCSSAHEEFWRPADYLSPTSTPDLTLGEGSTVPMVFREISSNLNELRRQLNQLESDMPEDAKIIQEPVETEMVELEDKDEAYIRDLLVATGLYDGSSDISISRWDPFAKPIGKSVFEEVEEAYKKIAKENESCIKDNNEKKKLDHRMLFDLVNEALSTILGPSVTMSRYRRKIIGSSMLRPPHGRKLLDCVWEIIRVYLHPPTDRPYYSLDSLVACDLASTPWSGLMDDEINALGREMECLIVRELVEEIVKDMQL